MGVGCTQEVRAEIDGFVASWSSGVDKHEGQSLGMVGTPAGDKCGAVSWQFAAGEIFSKHKTQTLSLKRRRFISVCSDGKTRSYMPKTGSGRQTCGKLNQNPNGLFVRREALGHRAARSALAVRPPLLRDELTRLDKATIDEVSMAGACVHCSTATTVLCVQYKIRLDLYVKMLRLTID